MIQLNNSNVAQRMDLKLDGYSATNVDDRLLIIFTCQLTGKQFAFPNSAVSSTNGRYQSVAVTPPPAPNGMDEGLYLVGIYNANASVTYATRLAFVSSPVPFGESTYTAYTTGDNAAYNVWTQ